MKKISIISLSILLAACASDTYEKGVTSESYTEDYKIDSIQAPITQQAQIQEVSINETPKMAAQTTTPMVAVQEEKKVVKLAPKPQVQKRRSRFFRRHIIS